MRAGTPGSPPSRGETLQSRRQWQGLPLDLQAHVLGSTWGGSGQEAKGPEGSRIGRLDMGDCGGARRRAGKTHAVHRGLAHLAGGLGGPCLWVPNLRPSEATSVSLTTSI